MKAAAMFKKFVDKQIALGNVYQSGEYKTETSKLIFQCGTCQTIYETTSRMSKDSKYPCHVCRKQAEKTRRLRALHGRFEELQEYGFTIGDLSTVNTRYDKVLIKCERGHTSYTNRNNLLANGCTGCNHEKQPNQFLLNWSADYNHYTKEFIISEMEIVHPHEFTFVGEVKDMRSGDEICLLCNVCGKQFSKEIRKLLKTRIEGCQHCSNDARRVGTAEMQKRINSLFPKRFDFTKFIYVEYDTKGIVICLECKVEFRMPPRYLYLGYGCKMCDASRGECIARIHFQSKNIEFEPQKAYGRLHFDFHIPKYNLYIEIDGEQHFKHQPYFGPIEKFKRAQANDHVKNEYCLINKFPLLRISYMQKKQIPQILDAYFELIDSYNKILLARDDGLPYDEVELIKLYKLIYEQRYHKDHYDELLKN